jgi:hypothetical protein
MKNTLPVIITLALIGIIMIFKSNLFLGSIYDLGGAADDECGNKYTNLTDDPFWSSAVAPDFSITGTNYASIYDSCSVKACVSHGDLAMNTGSSRKITYAFGPYKFVASFVTTLSNKRCVWSGNLYYNNNVINTWSNVPTPSFKMYLSNDGTINGSLPDYYFSSGGYSTSGSRCDEVNFNIDFLKTESMPCTYGTTIDKTSGNQIYCRGASNGINGVAPYMTKIDYDIIFVKTGNNLPCVVARELPITQRSENFVLVDGSSVSGQIISLQPGEEKEVQIYANIANLVREQAYEIQINATANSDEGVTTNDYQWYKE